MRSASLRTVFLVPTACVSAFALAVACSSSTTASHENPPAPDSGASKDGGGHKEGGGHASDGSGSGKGDSGGTTNDGGGASNDSGGDSGIAPPLVLPAPTADITWAANTIYLDESQASSLVKTIDMPVDFDGGSTENITLDGAMAKAANINPASGNIIVIYGQVMRLITGVTTDSAGDLVLATADTSLDLAATDANLAWQQAMELSPAAAMLAIDDPTNAIHIDKKKGLTVSRGMLAYSATFGMYTFDITMDMHGSSADLDITITKGTTAKVTISGTIERFVTSHSATISGGNFTNYTNSSPDVSGTLDLSVVAAGSLTDKVTETLPIPLFEFVELVGPIPVVETVTAEFTINGSVAVNSSVDVEASFDYDSTLGFTSNGTTVSAMASVGSPTIMTTKTPKSASAGDVAFSAGLAFPKLQVAAFGKTFIGYIYPAFVLGGSYTAVPACQQALATFLASAGYSLSVFGHKISSGSTVLYEDNDTLLNVGAGCPDAGN